MRFRTTCACRSHFGTLPITIFAGVFAVVAPTFAQHSTLGKIQNLKPKSQNGTAGNALPKTAKYAGTDVLATVEGQPITRHELTALWLLTDPKILPSLGKLVSEKWQASNVTAPMLTLREADLYARLYSDPTLSYTNLLANLVTNRLVAVESKKRGIVVTTTEAQTAGHVMLDDLRAAQGMTGTDAKMLELFHIPPGLFQNEMLFRLRVERLLRDDLARQNGHALRPDDWMVVRQLFVSVDTGPDGKASEAQYAAARERLDGWLREVKAGKSMADVARDHNEDSSRLNDGLRGPILRGTEPPELAEALRSLTPGTLSAPIRTPAGFYVFRMERRGTQIGEAERSTAWKQIVTNRQPAFLAALRSRAKITSVVPLPTGTGSARSGRSDGYEGPPAPPLPR